MEHEVVVPLPATVVRQALQDRELLARCIPGLSTDAATTGAPDGQIDGRLKLRIGGSTITYRGSLSLIEGREGVLTALAEGQEARGSGEVTATVRLGVQEHADGSLLRFSADLSADGRLAELPGENLDAAGRRLLDRFAADLAGELTGDTAQAGDADEAPVEVDVDVVAETPVEVDAETGTDAAAEDDATADNDAAAEDESPADEQRDGDTDGTPDGPAGEEDSDTEDEEGEEDEDGPENPDGAEATVVYLEDHAARDLDDDLSDLIAFSGDDHDHDPDPDHAGGNDGDRLPAPEPEPAAAAYGYQPDPALSGPVRRSIVGRSAEEVDHAPPHGRYAPTPPSRSARARAASRWGGAEPTLLTGGGGERNAMPWVIGGGVALLGGAVVLVRALRRR
ncbi:SRPBCC domain-containing protein [Kitasatospora sp. NBC_01539]|uniref:SRPBCC domain-containing protein n=1 Tax=Kitasatospora sp. NBC_01539 TaxID=2903577 RepID=UPI0038600DCA